MAALLPNLVLSTTCEDPPLALGIPETNLRRLKKTNQTKKGINLLRCSMTPHACWEHFALTTCTSHWVLPGAWRGVVIAHPSQEGGPGGIASTSCNSSLLLIKGCDISHLLPRSYITPGGCPGLRAASRAGVEINPPNLSSLPCSSRPCRWPPAWHRHRRDGGSCYLGEEVVPLHEKGQVVAEPTRIGTAGLPPCGAFRRGPQLGVHCHPPMDRLTEHPDPFSLWWGFSRGGSASSTQSYKKIRRDLRFLQQIPSSRRSRFSQGTGLKFQSWSQVQLSQRSLPACQLDALHPGFTGKASSQEAYEALTRSRAPHPCTKQGTGYVNGDRCLLHRTGFLHRS